MHNETKTRRRAGTVPQSRISAVIEPLEDRRLLSHGWFGFSFGGFGGFGFGDFGGGDHGFGRGLTSIEFSQAPAAVQTGLDNLASTDKLAAPTSNQTVFLGNQNGVETYTIDITGTGTQSALTVDQDGNPVTAPTNGTATYGTVPVAVSTEAAAIASALSLTVPASSATVSVKTPNGGTSVYSIDLTATTTTATRHVHGRMVEIDANGNPVGNVNLPFSAIPGSLQST